MRTSKTQSTCSPQLGLNHPTGKHSEFQWDDFLRDHENSNLHVCQGVTSVDMDSALTGPSNALEMTTDTRGDEPSSEPQFTRLQALECLTEESKKIYGRMARPRDLSKSERLCLILLGLGKSSPLSASQEKQLAADIACFICKVEKKIRDCKYNTPFFKKKHKAWLSKPFLDEIQDTTHSDGEIEWLDMPPSPQVETPSPLPPSLIENGKSDKTYEELSTRQQLRSRKKLQVILENEPPQKLIRTFSRSISVRGNLGKKLSEKCARDLESIINKCVETPNKPTEMLAKLNHETQPYTPEEALKIIIDRKLTVDTYKFLQQESMKRGFSLYPPYSQVAEVKRSC